MPGLGLEDFPAHLRETDCVAGHVRFELRNVDANYPLERSHRFAGIQPNSGLRDYSRLSCDGGSRRSQSAFRPVELLHPRHERPKQRRPSR
jgi:hypothetical protein